MVRRIFVALAAAVMLTQGVALYGLAGLPELAGLLGISFVLLALLPRRGAAVSVVASFFFATLLVWGMISGLGLYDKSCYRPDQMLVTYDMGLDGQRHVPDADVTMVQPFGDMGAMSADAAVPRVPREVRFRTDALGFRNDADLAREDVILIGDSFIQGSGSTQEDTLAAVLRSDYGIPSYAMGAPGDLVDYVARAKAHAANHQAPVLVFLFEGNDFARYDGKVRRLPERYVRRMHATDIGKFFRLQMARFKDTEEAANVRVMPVQGQPLAFYGPYVEEARREQSKAGPRFEPLLQSLAGLADAVFFIPAKYRVYAPLMGAAPLPEADWLLLKNACDAAGIPCHNLTEPMREAAAALWTESGRLLWWPDDTHWNRNGVDVAARVVADVLNDMAR